MSQQISFDDGEEVDVSKVAGVVSKSEAERRQFQAWHKPRKQWIREKQWWTPLKRLISNSYQNEPTLKYFGLPGGDLLDIEYIRRKLEERETLKNIPSDESKNLLFHGLIDNKEDKERADSRLSMLLDYKNIHKESKVEKYNFGSLKSEKSASWLGLRQSGPYHFINLDFCNCVFKEETLDSIVALMDFQLKRLYGTPWLLCLTTRVDRAGVNSTLYLRLNNLLQSLSEDDIWEKISECFEEASKAIDANHALDTDAINETTFSELIQICLILWLVAYALDHNSSIELASSVNYSVHAGNNFPDMASLVFRLTKKDIQVADSTGLTSSQQSAGPISVSERLKFKIQAISKLNGAQNVDSILEDIAVAKLYAEETKTLLSACGWDVSNYEATICPELA